MSITMYDGIANNLYPAGSAAVAGYVDGDLGDQPNAAWLQETFPQAQHLTITLFPDHDADAIDVENGASKPADIPAWVARQRERGVERPCIYGSVSTMEAQILQVLADADIGLPLVRLWTAHYGPHGPHICAPGTCGELSVEADGTQWTDNAVIDGRERNMDQSLLSDGFFGTVPADWTYGPPTALTAAGGRTSVKLRWQPPQGAPVPPAGYRIWVYKGTKADKSTLVPTYYRDAPAGTTTWQGGSLEEGQTYTAHVSAMGPEETRMRPYCFASALFRTS